MLFCDLVGSSALAEELGAEDFREVLRMVHESSAATVERLGGQVSQYLGDGLLALFGYPSAHEDDAARAVQAAVAIQEAIRAMLPGLRARLPALARLESRAAVHTGLVIIDEIGSGARRSAMALGDAVNVAARLQELAPAGATLITGATKRLVGSRFALEPHGTVTLRGLRTSFETYRVSGVAATATRHDAARHGERTPFVGRREELRRLNDMWAQVVAGRGQTVIVSGEPGIGKSRLLSAFRRQAPAGHRWLELHASPYHQASELRPVLDLVEGQVLHGETGAGARSRLEDLLRGVTSGGSHVAGLLARLLSLPSSEDPAMPGLLPHEQRQRVLNALVRWVGRLAREHPLVIVFEDLQWLDPTSMELLRTLVAAAADVSLMLLATCRTPFEPPWDRPPHEWRVTLPALTREEAERLVAGLAPGQQPPPHMLREVLAKSDGVPLFLEEVTGMLLESSSAHEPVPDTLRELLAARLDRLPVAALETGQLASVIGRDFPRDLLLAVSAKAEASVDDDIAVLVDADILRRERERYTFKHALVRDAAYERMLRATRAGVHARVAAALRQTLPHVADTQPELVARHLSEAGALDDAAREWVRAGRRSLGNGAYVEASAAFEHALAAHDRLACRGSPLAVSEELELRKDYGVSLIATQGYSSPAVADNYACALRLSAGVNDEDGTIPVHVLYGLWGTCLVRGDREATDELARHFERAEHSSDPLVRHVAHSTLGARAFYRGDFAAARRHCEQAMLLYEPSHHFALLRDYGYEGGLYSHLYQACVLCFTGYPDRGREVAREALTLATAIGDFYSKAVCLGLAACVARERRDAIETRALASELIGLAAEHQFPMWLGIGHCLRGWSALAAGDAAAGAEEIHEGLALWETTGAKVPGTYLRLNLVDASLARGDVDTGLAIVERGLEQCAASLESYQKAEYHRLRGELLARTGATARAEAEMRTALTMAHEHGAAWWELRAALSLARLLPAVPERWQPLARITPQLTEGRELPEMREALSLLAVGP